MSNEKMIIISSSNTTMDPWPQDEIDEKRLMVSSYNSMLMEKPISQQHHHQQQQHQQQQVLKCPRCDSSNTKFCYYNNYSLSQPRHFCKACKRYWTRGGSLRNVPVGGCFRKNKRVKKPTTTTTTTSTTVNAIGSSSLLVNPSRLTTSSSLNHQINMNMNMNENKNNSLFYGLINSTNPSSYDILKSDFNPLSTRFSDLQPQFSSNGLGFSSFHQIFGSSSSSSVLPANMVPFLQGQPIGNPTHQLASVYDHQTVSKNQNDNMEWNYDTNEGYNCQNDQQQTGLSSSSPDPNNNSIYWNGSSNGVWNDPSNNIGSSVTSLI